MERNIDKYLGYDGFAKPRRDDVFEEFYGTCVGTRNGLLQVQDQDDNVFELLPEQFDWIDEDHED